MQVKERIQVKTSGQCPECRHRVPVVWDITRPLEDDTIPEPAKYFVGEHNGCPGKDEQPLHVYNN